MPYEVRKMGAEWCIFKKDTNEKVGCSDSEEKAHASVRARYAAEASTTKELDYCLDDRPQGFVAKAKHLLGLDVPKSSGSVQLLKTKDGRLRFVMAYSNNFEDRHGETLTEAAHKEYESWVDHTKLYPVARIWHIKGTEWGQADGIGFDDSGFSIVTGLVYPGSERLAHRLAELDMGVSHGFVCAQEGNDVVRYRTFEVSPLPFVAAANVWHDGMDILQEGLVLTKEKRDFFVNALGMSEEFVEGLEKSYAVRADALHTENVKQKDTEPPPTPPKPDEPPSDGEDFLGGLQRVLEPVVSRLDALTTDVTEIKQKQEQYATSLHDEVEKAYTAKVADLPQGYSASEKNKAAEGAENTTPQTEWFASLVEGVDGVRK